ncbi:MAG: hypothetical protein WA947_02280 [Phormidesmis sp.]
MAYNNKEQILYRTGTARSQFQQQTTKLFYNRPDQAQSTVARRLSVVEAWPMQ